MAKCECISECAFFKEMMNNMPVMTDRLKKRYCLLNPEGCARYQVFLKLGSGKAPPDLFPSHNDRAKEIIAEALERSDEPSEPT